ncbi:extracellular solute-binding protein [Lipingzhangella sp. LS1_29]|uniref:Extracellular solute-binding protein n=1 Tax=Lipingzhangella rawalii TaxID=2055835 RepID=A0ABU2H4Y1_9ACTN|nr:extracellular solute-binding protein [Lipingzhangella rawalii]MDS1269674.1 extracellular solute-binding protein [Lipingzhangella rawalii]
MRDASPTQPGSGLARRGFLKSSFVLAGLGLAACTPADAVLDTRVRLRQWNLFSGGDGNRMIQMHEDFQAQHPDLDFRATTFEWGAPFYTKVAMAAAGGRAADVATVHLSRLASLAPGRLLDPVDEGLLAEAGIDASVFLPNVWEQCFHDGQLYAIPLDTHTHIQYFNPEICAEAGLLDGDGRLTEVNGLEEFLDMCREIAQVTGDMAVSLDTTYSWPIFWAMFRQQDGELSFTDDDFHLDDEAAYTAFEALYRLSEEGLAPRFADGQGATSNFDNLQAGLLLQGNWEIASFEATGTPYSATQMPNFFGNRRTRGDAHCFVLPHQENRDRDRTRAALTYAAWMVRNSLSWGEGGGHIPAYQPVVRSEEYQPLEPHVHYAEAAANTEFEPEAWFSGSASQLQSEAAAALNGIHAGTATPKDALHQFRRSLRSLVTTPAPV